MKGYIRHRKWIVMATLTMGTAFQVSTCQNDAALFGLRWAFTSFTLPINTLIRDLLLTVL